MLLEIKLSIAGKRLLRREYVVSSGYDVDEAWQWPAFGLEFRARVYAYSAEESADAVKTL